MQPHSQQDEFADPAEKLLFFIFFSVLPAGFPSAGRISGAAGAPVPALGSSALPVPAYGEAAFHQQRSRTLILLSKLGPGNAVTQLTCFRVEEANVTGRVWLIKAALTDRTACFGFLDEMHGPCI